MNYTSSFKSLHLIQNISYSDSYVSIEFYLHFPLTTLKHAQHNDEAGNDALRHKFNKATDKIPGGKQDPSFVEHFTLTFSN